MPDRLLAVARGLAVFPIPAGGRRPAGPGWQRGALLNAAQVRRCWRWGDNVGIGCWRCGVVGLDPDPDPERGRGGRGGYLIGPGSLVTGPRYVITHNAAIAQLPAWLAHIIVSG